ncbi:aminoacyl-tRNA hydrolase [Candidatus Parcubacteria bacterium]|nr:MAG: aminoacyl-tRNA hydrolase [Candidatus Parcubacteria bacterium]
MKIIVGLGNPGDKYEKTRHNVGFIFLDALAQDLDLDWQEDKKRKAYVARDSEFMLIKPFSFMNLSGEPLKAVLSYYKILPKNFKIFLQKNNDFSENLYVVHDDFDIEFGKYKMSTDSRSAGHNGVQSIINHLKTKNFNRYRVGIKNKQTEFIPKEKFVLQRFSREEEVLLPALYQEIIKDIKEK